MIKENQRLLNWLNVGSDGLIIFLLLPPAYWLRFYVLPGGVSTVPFERYILLDVFITAIQLFTFASFGLYHSFRSVPLQRELPRLWGAGLLDMLVLLSVLFIQHYEDYSRLTIGIFFVLNMAILSGKRLLLRTVLRRLRQKGFNQKHVVIIGGGALAEAYLKAIQKEQDLGYHAVGYIARKKRSGKLDIPYLGNFDTLEAALEKKQPDEVVSAIEMEDYSRVPRIIAACEKAGIKLSIIPFYADYIPSNPQFDDIGGIPLMNIRRIPLDNLFNAFCKRLMDITGSLLLLVAASPVMLLCALGVRLTSPGPVIFRQIRVGRHKRNFTMYKFRSMRMNPKQDSGWSQNHDDRKTKFGAFLRKCSLDEFPQFFNVLKGDMSLVGPRPELPHFVDQFREEIPLYMVKHQVRPGITGWAQVNGFRGDTSIKERIEHDLYYIEHWSLLFDIKILFMTVFGGKFINGEELR